MATAETKMDTFVITGMTCANCSARIEKELNGTTRCGQCHSQLGH
jgi:P-type Cu+ transporter